MSDFQMVEGFCGKGGWSRPFVEDGDDVCGFDIVDVGYVAGAVLILKDVREIDGRQFAGSDAIFQSPPCREFSVAGCFGNGPGKYHWKVPQDPQKGLELIREAKRIVDEAKPRFWAIENVTNGEPYINPILGKPIYHFRLSRKGFRSLWGNFAMGLTDEYAPDHILMKVKKKCHGKTIDRRSEVKNLRNSANRAEIPYPIARAVANRVKSLLQEQVVA